ncbi:MAG: helix-turn-helix transcriptional regulator [Planctomycetota bacterium]|jgi:transcriptional regulator with XRE-family HTH domain|nr:helix-turn-helix transcriptional regulator [Planctomycetota bacterium]
MPSELRETIAGNIRDCRQNKFPGRGGGKKCAEAFGVSPQQWSPWERGMRTPDELRLSQIAAFFGVSVEYLRRDNSAPREKESEAAPHAAHPASYGGFNPRHSLPREPDAPPYGLPSLRREDHIRSGTQVAELAMAAARLMGMVGATAKGVTDGKYDVAKSIIVLRRLGDLLAHRLREAETSAPQAF